MLNLRSKVHHFLEELQVAEPYPLSEQTHIFWARARCSVRGGQHTELRYTEQKNTKCVYESPVIIHVGYFRFFFQLRTCIGTVIFQADTKVLALLSYTLYHTYICTIPWSKNFLKYVYINMTVQKYTRKRKRGEVSTY